MQECLANTGDGFWWITPLGVLLVVAVIILLAVPKHRRYLLYRGLSVLVITVTLGFNVIGGGKVAAAGSATCGTLSSQPDTSSGVLGAVQVRNVLANDTPTPGSNFVASSLRLALRTGHVLGASISVDRKTVTAPTEGVYVAGNDGSITYTPDSSFVGTAVGVDYSIQDTAGNITTNVYVPTVTSSCTLQVLQDLNFTQEITNNAGIITVFDSVTPNWMSNSTNSPAIDPYDIDLDPNTSGIQTSLTNNTESWTATYVPATDTLTVTVSDPDIYIAVTRTPLFTYTIAVEPGCAEPTSADVEVIKSISMN